MKAKGNFLDMEKVQQLIVQEKMMGSSLSSEEEEVIKAYGELISSRVARFEEGLGYVVGDELLLYFLLEGMDLKRIGELRMALEELEKLKEMNI